MNSRQSGPSDLALIGQILGRKEAGGILIRDGRIASLGSEASLREAARAAGAQDSQIMRLPEGALAVPGLVDAHVHLIATGERLGHADLFSARNSTQAAQILAQSANAVGAPGGWIQGRGWRPDRLGGYPTARDLDAVFSERPVVARAYDGHTLWVNSAALRLAGIGSETPDPEGGRIRRAENGTPTGILHENACELIWKALPAPTRAQKKEYLRQAAAQMARSGFTGVHDVEGLETVELAAELDAEGELPLRVSGMCRPEELDNGAAALWLHEARETPRVRLFALKLFLDGTFTSSTAWMLTPYQSGGTGMNVIPLEELGRRMREAARLGLYTAVHVIGDRAVRELLDEVERFRSEPERSQPSVVDAHRGGRGPVRFRAEHAQLIDPQDLARFKALEVAASVQPAHLVDDFPVLLEHFPHRADCAYPFRSLRQAGAPMCLSSDSPIVPADPGACLHAAVARRAPGAAAAPASWHPEQALEIGEALALYAEGAAWAEGLEDRRGRLVPGLDADLTLLGHDPLGLSPEELLRLPVLGTVVGGRMNAGTQDGLGQEARGPEASPGHCGDA